MGFPQSNQQTGFIGYPTNQLYNPADLQFMQTQQRDFRNWGNWQPGMTRTNQWMADPGDNYGAQGLQTYEQTALNDYYARVGTPYEQSQRQGYWQQMGGQVYGGVIPPTDNPLDPVVLQAYNRQANTPWGDLNNMGISSAYAMPAWQQQYYNSQNASITGGQGDYGGQAPIEQFSNTPFSNSSYGVPNSFSPVTPNNAQQNFSQQPQSAAAPGAMGSQSPSPWGSNLGSRDSPWGNPSNWGSQNYMWGW